jgi:hypothetical protein
VERYASYPAPAEASAVQASETECATGTTPAPEREMVAGELVALLATVTLPVMLPVADGEKVTFSAAFCPGARIKPEETPLAANFPPATLTPEMVTLELPALMTVMLRVLLVPVVTFPKLKLETLELRSAAAATPVPLTETVVGELEISLRTDTCPVTAPLA